MTWQIALTLSVLAGVARMLFTRRYSQTSKIPSTIPPAASFLFGILPIGLIAGLFIFPHAIAWSWWVVFLIAILAAVMAFSNWLGFLAAGKLAIAPQQTISLLTNVSVVVLGWTFLGESLTTAQFVGGGILLVAASLAIMAPTKTKAGDFERIRPKTIIIAVTAAVLLAIGFVTEKALLGHMEIGGIFLISWTTQTIGALLLASKDINRTTLRAFKGREFKWSTFVGVLSGINGAFYIYAIFHSDNVSLISVLSTIALPLTVLGAYIFLREREHHLLMWLSLAISFVGLLVMALA